MNEQVNRLQRVLEQTAVLIADADPASAGAPTPCPGFDVAALVGHIAQFIEVFAGSAAGVQPPAAPADGEWPAPELGRFRTAAGVAVEAFRNGAADRPLTLMGGPIPGSMVLGMMLTEYVSHGWDLAVSTGQPVPYADADAEAALAATRGMLTDDFRGPDKSFAPQVPVPDDAPAIRRFLGFVGRDPDWRAG